MTDPRPLGYDTRFGSGWISGVFAVAFGVLGFGAVLCLWFPSLLTTPEARAIYPMDLVRFIIHLVLVAAFGLGVLSVMLSRRAVLALIGIGLSTIAVLMGGSQVAVEGPVHSSTYAGLDWFLLDVLILALLFVPLERIFARLPAQGIFRRGWATDLAHFATSHLLVQFTVLLTMLPAAIFFRWAVSPRLQGAIASQPLLVQFVEVVIIADLSEYVVHRLFHRVPLLWRFHAVHHSSQAMDWLAGSRLHLVDILITRGLSFVPLYVLGFATPAVYAYLLFVSFHAVFIHANVRFRLGGLEWLLVTPRLHHWHHAAHPVDKNFAVHLPVIDRLFGTYYGPDERWPAVYGIEGNPIPESYLRQLVMPFRR